MVEARRIQERIADASVLGTQPPSDEVKMRTLKSTISDNEKSKLEDWSWEMSGSLKTAASSSAKSLLRESTKAKRVKWPVSQSPQ